MKGIGEGIAFAATVVCAAWLQVSGEGSFWLWVLVAAWAIGSDWGQK